MSLRVDVLRNSLIGYNELQRQQLTQHLTRETAGTRPAAVTESLPAQRCSVPYGFMIISDGHVTDQPGAWEEVTAAAAAAASHGRQADCMTLLMCVDFY